VGRLIAKPHIQGRRVVSEEIRAFDRHFSARNAGRWINPLNLSLVAHCFQNQSLHGNDPMRDPTPPHGRWAADDPFSIFHLKFLIIYFS
jgi:hypothetical protein